MIHFELRIFRLLRRAVMAVFRTVEGIRLFLGGMPWKIERFNRLVEGDVSNAIKAIRAAEAVVGIPFHKEVSNIGSLVKKALADLESRDQRAAIVIVGEHKTRESLFVTNLPSSTERVTIVRFTKPPGFGQKPGLSRRSWSHWAILQVANRLRADIVFIDADVQNSEGWINLYLDAIQKHGATVAVANYVRSFGRDDAIVHIWDRLIFGALFKKWIAFRHGGDYSLSRTVIPEILRDPSIMRERAYTMDSAVMARVAQRGGRIESVWLGRKMHESITPMDLFSRLPDLVESVFDDIANHLPVLLRLPDSGNSSAEPVPDGSTSMQELIGIDFRHELHQDIVIRFRNESNHIRGALGNARFLHYARLTSTVPATTIDLPPAEWAKATLRFIARYIRSNSRGGRTSLAKAYVPILEAGILGFLNRTYHLSYEHAFEVLEREYMPAFQQTWNRLVRRLVVFRVPSFGSPLRVARRGVTTLFGWRGLRDG